MGDNFMVKDMNSQEAGTSMVRGGQAYQALTAADEQARQRSLAQEPAALQVLPHLETSTCSCDVRLSAAAPPCPLHVLSKDAAAFTAICTPSMWFPAFMLQLQLVGIPRLPQGVFHAVDPYKYCWKRLVLMSLYLVCTGSPVRCRQARTDADQAGHPNQSCEAAKHGGRGVLRAGS